MRLAYFDCFSGISGNMILGSLFDAGVSYQKWNAEIKKLNLPPISIKVSSVKRAELKATYVEVKPPQQKKTHTLLEIEKIIRKSTLEKKIKEKSIDIFQRLARAEGEIHRVSPQKVHFHELGGLDCLFDIVGSLIGLKLLGVQKVYSSPLNLGSGFVKCNHGILPVPAPATLALLTDIPIYQTESKNEFVTPTGAAIITGIAERFGPLPEIRLQRIGYGAGSKDLPLPNVLRLIIGETLGRPDYIGTGEIEDKNIETVVLLETNLDNISPEVLGYCAERLLKNGALDVFFTPIYMKKQRPAVMLSVIAPPDKIEKIQSLIFAETGSLGIRFQEIKRRTLLREISFVSTKYGEIQVKIGKDRNRIITLAPEYEDCRKLAQKYKIPFKEVFEEAKRRWTLDAKRQTQNAMNIERKASSVKQRRRDGQNLRR